MRYFKTVYENNIIDFGYCGKYIPVSSIEITEEEYAQLEVVIASKPADTLESIYRLSAETEQYEPFDRTHEETVVWYVEKVNSGEMTIEEVPTDYKSEVEQLVTPSEEPDLYQQGYEQALIDLAETTGGME